MQRLTISIDDELAATFDRLVAEKGYGNRSEAFRDLVRKALGEEQLSAGKAKHCVGTLSYVYNHHERSLAERLTTMQHEHHDLTVSTMHAHLDHENCIETVIVRGPTAAVTTTSTGRITPAIHRAWGPARKTTAQAQSSLYLRYLADFFSSLPLEPLRAFRERTSSVYTACASHHFKAHLWK